MTGAGEALRDLLQKFVDGVLDAPQLFARAGDALPEDTDATDAVLELLAESELHLRLPQGRAALIRRLEQAASGETSFTELDLWFFSLLQIDEVNRETPSDDPEIELLRTIVQWSQAWEETDRPTADQLKSAARTLRSEHDPAACLQGLKSALAPPSAGLAGAAEV